MNTVRDFQLKIVWVVGGISAGVLCLIEVCIRSLVLRSHPSILFPFADCLHSYRFEVSTGVQGFEGGNGTGAVR